MSGLFDQITNYSPPLLTAGQVNYKGTWDASANSPALTSPPAATTKGDYYVVSVAGTQFSITFAVGDWIISNGTAWEKVDLTDAVSSVFGRTGAVVGASTDYSSVGLTNTAIGASSPSTGAFTTVTASSTIAATGAVTGSNLSGTNTGDQTISITGDATASGSTGVLTATVSKINGTALSGLATGILKNTTTTGVPSIAVAADFPTLNQNTTGSAATLTTPRAIYGNNFDGSAALTQVIASTYGGTGNGFAKFSGPASSEKTFTLPNASSTLLYDGGALGTPASGTVTNLTGTASININGTVGATTPSTIAATSGTFSGSVTLANGQAIRGTTTSATTGQILTLSGDNNIYIGAVDVGGNVIVRANAGSTVGTFTSTGLNSTAIGATTASTGAFTTLSATGLITSTVGNNTTILNSASATTGYQIFNVQNTSGRFQFGIEASVGGNLITGSTPYAACLSTVGNKPVQIGVDQALIGSFSSTGLAVTGVLSASGTTTVGPNNTGTGLALLQLFGGSGTNGGASVYFGTNGTAYSSIGQLSGIIGGTSTDLTLYANNGGQSIKFYAGGGGNVATITSTGLGIGTSSPDAGAKLTVAGGILATAAFSATTGSTGGFDYISGALRFFSIGTSGSTKGAYSFIAKGADGSSSQRMTLDASGNLGIGTTSPDSILTFAGNITSKSSDDYGIGTNGNNNHFNVFATGASGAVRFWTGGSSATGTGGGGTERARIDSSGNLLVGTTSTNFFTGSNKGILLDGSIGLVAASRDGDVSGLFNRYTSDGDLVQFRRSGTTVGTISVTTTATAYNTSSDYRLKDITGPLTDSGAFIDALKPKVGTWKSNGDKFVGFLAHEFAEVSPFSVVGEKDAVDADGKPKYQSMQASSAEVIANLVAELKSLRQRVAALESSN